MAVDTKSLAIAYGVQRRNKAKTPRGPSRDLFAEIGDRPNSVAEAILRKRRDAKIRDEDEGLVDFEDSNEPELSELDELSEEAAVKTKSYAPVLKENQTKARSIAESIFKKRKAQKV